MAGSITKRLGCCTETKTGAEKIMIWKERIGDELYVYYNGHLIYKRWIRLGYGKVFQP